MTMPGILARAAALGILPPTYREDEKPQLWECWRDRVLQAESDAGRGRDPASMCREAAIYGGHPVPPAPLPPAPIPGPAPRYGIMLDHLFETVIPQLILEQTKTEGSA